MSTDTTAREQDRVAALHRLGVLGTPPEERFDRVVRLARQLFDVPTALVSLVDRDVVVHKAEGAWVTDVEGKRYLDLLAAYSAVNQGHCHPRLIKTVQDQLPLVTLTSRAFRNDRLGVFYQTVTQLAGFEKFLPMNTGAEAVETAIKAARKWAYKVKGVPDGQAETKITRVNDERVAATVMGEPEQFSFAGAGGDTVSAYVVKPAGFDPAVKYPVAFLIHGGPQGSMANQFHYRWNPQAYAGRGYATVTVDFHGSTGYGQAFTDAIRNDWAGKPFEDAIYPDEKHGFEPGANRHYLRRMTEFFDRHLGTPR